MNTLIVGAGYAGLNAYHILKSQIVSDKKDFLFFTAYTRKLLFNEKIKFYKTLKFVKQEKVVDFDLKSKWVKTEKTEYAPDNLIISAGCDKSHIIDKIKEIRKKENISLSSEEPLNDYLTIQLAFYLKKLGKEVKYHGDYLNYLGEKVSNVIRSYMEKYGIRYTERPEDLIPTCSPSYPFESYKVDEYLRYKNTFILGDLINGFPMLGELAMRTGIYAASHIMKKTNSPFKPIFITIIDTSREGIHIRSDKPWGGYIQSVKVSKIRQIMKRFIERYYLFRNGKMGILYYV